MIKIDRKTRDQLIELWKNKKISLEGNLLKLIDPEGDSEFTQYLNEAKERDIDLRRKRLSVTAKVQEQNKELLNWKSQNETINQKLKQALDEAETFNREMLKAKEDTEIALAEAQTARVEAEKARQEAEKARQEAEIAKTSAVNDLELLQKKTQFELIGSIVKVALWVILGVGITVTLVYMICLFAGFKTDVIGSAWVNIMSILLTNAFSIIGTLMGMKTVSDKNTQS